MKIALIIFTKNEYKNSKRIFRKIPRKAINRIYVIDGGSKDGTVEFWKSKGIKVYGQKFKGVGGAYESAFRNTKEDALIFFHPDGNMEPKDIAIFINRLKRGEEFIIASRMMSNGKNEEDDQFIKPRKWSIQAMANIINLLWANKNSKVTDLTQGFRAITRQMYEKLEISIPNAVAPDTEQIIKAMKKGIKIVEFPTKEGERAYGETSMRTFSTSIENIKVFLKELFT